MAITIQAQLAKKLPIPGIGMSSQQASITISAEVTDLNQVVAEAHRLYALAEQAVDAQLAGTPVVQPTSVAPSVPTASPNPSQSPAQRLSASQPYRSGSPPRRQAAAPISAAQARYLSQLGQRAQGALAEALAQHGVTTIDALTGRDASKIIGHLLQVAA